MSPKELQKELADKRILLIDVREKFEYDTVHIEPCTLIPMQTIPQQLDKIPKDAKVAVMCHHGVRSQNVINYLKQVGYTNLHNVDGGIDAYAREVDHTLPTY